MVMVCKDWKNLTKNKNKAEKFGFGIDGYLKENLDVLIKNVKNDWDFTIIISGRGEVRVGKSVLAMQIAAYWTDQIRKIYKKDIPFDTNNFVFEGSKLIEKGNWLGINHPYSPLIFDEAGADLEGVKAMKATTQAVKDFYRECGQYNLLNILVLPEFFDLPKGIALSRSFFLIDVSYEVSPNDMFERGHFKFYSKSRKKFLYLKGKKDLDYNAVEENFFGTFPEFYPIDEEAYRKSKQVALKQRQYLNAKEQRMVSSLSGIIKHLKNNHHSYQDIADIINSNQKMVKVSHMYVKRLIENDDKYDDSGVEIIYEQ